MRGTHAPSVVARPGLFERLSAGFAGGVTLVSAPPGSGKTVLLHSWIDEANLANRAAWVSVRRDEQDPQRFWLSVLEQLRAAVGSDAVIAPLAPSPQFDGSGLVQRLIAQLAGLDRPILLVIDDLHELRARHDRHRQLVGGQLPERGGDLNGQRPTTLVRRSRDRLYPARTRGAVMDWWLIALRSDRPAADPRGGADDGDRSESVAG